jgi:hypothetical protein
MVSDAGKVAAGIGLGATIVGLLYVMTRPKKEEEEPDWAEVFPPPAQPPPATGPAPPTIKYTWKQTSPQPALFGNIYLSSPAKYAITQKRVGVDDYELQDTTAGGISIFRGTLAQCKAEAERRG